MKRRLIILLGLLIFSIIGAGCSTQFIEDYEIWLIHEVDDKSSFYGFYVDAWGSGINSITVTSPSDKTYNLEYEAEESAWSYGKTGQNEILTEFADGTYILNVTYADSTTEVINAEFGGSIPPLPVLTSIDENTISWEEWVDPEDPHHIEVDIEPEEGNATEQQLSYTATSYDIPNGFLENNMTYEIEIWFYSSKYPHSNKASELNMTYQN